MKNYLLAIVSMICISCSVPIDTIECRSDWDCMDSEICSGNICVSDYSPYHPGDILLECGCWDIYEEDYLDDKCLYGFSVSFPCYDWCPNGTQSYGIMCE